MSNSQIAEYTLQPDMLTCQAACCAKMAGMTTAAQVFQVRRELLEIARTVPGGMAGSPSVMSRWLRPRVKGYTLDMSASLADMRDWLTKDGENTGHQIILHIATPGSGHVVSLEEWNGTHFVVDDPLWEFDFPRNRWMTGTSGNDTLCSPLAIYSYGVVAHNNPTAVVTYRAGQVDWSRKGAWAHYVNN